MGLRDSNQQGGIMSLFLSTVGAFAAQSAVPLAHSRKLETQADKIGITLSSRAGYDPSLGKKVWERMKASEQGKGVPFVCWSID